jgi:hypothetical protein
VLLTASVGRQVIGNTDQYTKLSCAVEQLCRAPETGLTIFSSKYEDGRKGASTRREINVLGLRAGKQACMHCICEAAGQENGCHSAVNSANTAVGRREGT